MHNNFTRIYKINPRRKSFISQTMAQRLLWVAGALLVIMFVTLIFAGLSEVFSNLLIKLFLIPTILISLSVHEFAHALMADFLGDSTPRRMGRLTLNPLKHLDFMGTLMLIFVKFGWAKPVQVNPRSFRNPRRAMLSVALAGPISNMLLAILGMLSLKILALFANYLTKNALAYIHVVPFMATVIQTFIIINLGLMVFNLLPIPPLDGSRVISYFLPPKYLVKYQEFQHLAPMVLLGFILLGGTKHILSPIVIGSYQFLQKIFF